MTQSDKFWEKERKRLIGLIRSGKIEYDYRFILIKIDSLLQLSRIDLIPCTSADSFEAEIDFIEKGNYLPPIVPIESINLDNF